MDHLPSEYLDLSHAPAVAVIDREASVWKAISQIEITLANHDWERDGGIDPGAEVSPHAHIGERVRLGFGTRVAAGATILGPAWIGDQCEIRPGAFLRPNVIAGNGVVLGNSCEFKNCILFDSAEIPHFSYVGDSILGYKAHLGAGVILSNVRLDRRTVCVPAEPGAVATIDTGLRKFSAIVGDHVEIGCNSVISPGGLLGRNCVLYPGTQWRGALAANTIVKLAQEQTLLVRRDRSK